MKKFKYVCPYCNTESEISVEYDDELHIVVCSSPIGKGCERVFVAYKTFSGTIEYYCLVNFEKIKMCRHEVKNKLAQISLSTIYLKPESKAKTVINFNVQQIKEIIDSIDCGNEDEV